MRTLLVAAALVVAITPFAHADTVIASGHILVGAPTTALVAASEAGIDGVDSFSFPVTPGQVITTSTTDHSELGYDLDFYFFAADGTYVASECQTVAIDEVCTVPAGAAIGEVAAFFGANLDVDVLAI